MKEKRHKKVECPECGKRNPHNHKGSNESGTLRRKYTWEK